MRISDWSSDVCSSDLMRLVKGAYWDTEIKRAQTLGLADFPVFTAKLHTDLNYLHCAQILRECQDCLFPAFASHNAMTLAFVTELFAGADYELQRLPGMGEAPHGALFAVAKQPARAAAASAAPSNAPPPPPVPGVPTAGAPHAPPP